MRVKPAGASGEESDTTSDKTSQSTTADSQSSMGYTKGSAPATAYPQPAYPNFFDLLDSPDAEETDSPLPAELEEEFLDMLAETDIGMYPPPPYQGPTGYSSQSAYPATYPNQYMQSYTPYANYGYAQGMGPGVMQNAINPQNSKGAAKVVQSPANNQLALDSGDNQDIYAQGETLMQDLQTVVDKKPIIVPLQSVAKNDPLRTIAKKVGITADSGDNSSTHSNESETATAPQQPVSADSSPVSRRTTKTDTNSKRKISTSARARAKKETIVVDVPEEILYEEAQSRPIKHRKEPDIVESKDRSVRNAINARVNRQKHKLYVDSLEQEVEDLKKANQELDEKYQNSLSQVADMQKHIKYLENVIANDITISNILTSLKTVENVTLSSSVSRKRKLLSSSSDSAMDLSEPAAKVSAGVCLHVDKHNVSIEFCEKCAEKAQATMNGTTSPWTSTIHTEKDFSVSKSISPSNDCFSLACACKFGMFVFVC